MLGLKNKDKDITLSYLDRYINNDDNVLVGVRFDTSYTSNLACEPMLVGTTIEDGGFFTDIVIKPDIAQHQMVKELNTSLHDKGLGFVVTDHENPVMADSTVDTLISRIERYEGTYEIPDYVVKLGFHEPHSIQKTTTKLTSGLELDIFKIHMNMDDVLFTLYLSFTKYQYDGQTMLGLLSKDKLSRIDTLKILTLISSNNLFGDRVISAKYKTNNSTSSLYDTTHKGMGILVPDLSELKEFPKFVVSSGESEIFLDHSDIVSSNVVAINKKRHKYIFSIKLKKSYTLDIMFD